MITLNQNGVFYGLSTDDKPQYIEHVVGIKHSIQNGTKLFEIDTGKVYRYDGQNKRWCLISSGGNSSSSGDSEEYIDIDDESF